MKGEKKQVRSILKFSGKPSKGLTKERSKWRKFLTWLNPFAKKTNDLFKEAKGLTKEYYEAEINLKNSEAENFEAEAAEKSANAKLKTTENSKAVNDEITKIFTSDLPDKVKMLQLATIMSSNPEIVDQLKKIEGMMDYMKVVNFSEFNIQIERPTIQIKKGKRSDRPYYETLEATGDSRGKSIPPHGRMASKFSAMIKFIEDKDAGTRLWIAGNKKAKVKINKTLINCELIGMHQGKWENEQIIDIKLLSSINLNLGNSFDLILHNEIIATGRVLNIKQ